MLSEAIAGWSSTLLATVGRTWCSWGWGRHRIEEDDGFPGRPCSESSLKDVELIPQTSPSLWGVCRTTVERFVLRFAKFSHFPSHVRETDLWSSRDEQSIAQHSTALAQH